MQWQSLKAFAESSNITLKSQKFEKQQDGNIAEDILTQLVESIGLENWSSVSPIDTPQIQDFKAIIPIPGIRPSLPARSLQPAGLPLTGTTYSGATYDPGTAFVKSSATPSSNLTNPGYLVLTGEKTFCERDASHPCPDEHEARIIDTIGEAPDSACANFDGLPHDSITQILSPWKFQIAADQGMAEKQRSRPDGEANDADARPQTRSRLRLSRASTSTTMTGESSSQSDLLSTLSSIPKLDRTVSDVYQDELYDSSMTASALSSQQPQKIPSSDTNGFASRHARGPSNASIDSQVSAATASHNSRSIFNERLQDANSARSASPSTSFSMRQRSPFRDESAFAGIESVSQPSINLMSPVNQRSAAYSHPSTINPQEQRLRFDAHRKGYNIQDQQLADSAAQIRQTSSSLPISQMHDGPLQTISPKEAMLNYDPDEDMDDATTLLDVPHATRSARIQPVDRIKSAQLPSRGDGNRSRQHQHTQAQDVPSIQDSPMSHESLARIVEQPGRRSRPDNAAPKGRTSTDAINSNNDDSTKNNSFPRFAEHHADQARNQRHRQIENDKNGEKVKEQVRHGRHDGALLAPNWTKQQANGAAIDLDDEERENVEGSSRSDRTNFIEKDGFQASVRNAGNLAKQPGVDTGAHDDFQRQPHPRRRTRHAPSADIALSSRSSSDLASINSVDMSATTDPRGASGSTSGTSNFNGQGQLNPSYPFISHARRQSSSLRSITSSDVVPEFPASFTSMESTKSESAQEQHVKPPAFLPQDTLDSSQRSREEGTSVPRVSPLETTRTPLTRPDDTSANAGSYTCTADQCTARFDSATRLQNHRRRRHARSASSPGATTTTASASGSPVSTASPRPITFHSKTPTSQTSQDATSSTPISSGHPSKSSTTTISLPSSSTNVLRTRNSRSHSHSTSQPAVSGSPNQSQPQGELQSMNANAPTAHGPGPHKCEKINPSTGKPCNTIFSRSYDLTRHEDTIHSNRKVKVRCQLCTEEKTFSRNDALTRHMRVVHPTVEFRAARSRRSR